MGMHYRKEVLLYRGNHLIFVGFSSCEDDGVMMVRAKRQFVVFEKVSYDEMGGFI
jgi:hypothetical protein